MLRHKLAAALLACGFVAATTPAAVATAAAKPAAAPQPAAWVQKSNAAAQPLLKVLAEFQPEFASQIGIPGYDTRVSDLKPGVVERANQAIAAAKAGLEKQLAAEKDPQVRQDLEIMIHSADQQIEGNTLNAKYLLPYYDVGQTIFQGEFALLQDQVDAKRRPAALARLKCYVGMAPGCEPIVKLAEARTEEKLGDQALLGPYKGEVEQNLANTQRYVDGVRQLYAKYKIAGAEPALDALAQQLKDYDAWVKATVLPRARTDFRLPPELYAFNLKQVGVDITPEQLMQKAELEFMETQAAMQMIAPEVARANGIDAHDYRDVIKALKKEQLDRGSVEPYYHEIIGKIEDIIRRERIVTLPQRAMQMRLASEAESAAQPAPHMDPPALINNKGERGTFVLTMGNPSSTGDKSQAYDDFTHKSAAWTLTAHEGRPGHELQFAAMVERGVSLARSLFAFNSVNVEGWALYAEAEMLPYEPPAGQLFALQARLQRAARAFLDPMLNLGLISRERAHDILVHDVGLSEAMTRQELDRYTFRMPGQATSYFYGYTRLLQLRAATQIALGDKFDRQAFNDFVIGQGLLPPDLLAQAVKSEFIPAQMKK